VDALIGFEIDIDHLDGHKVCVHDTFPVGEIKKPVNSVCVATELIRY